jgi:hypothetical protein
MEMGTRGKIEARRWEWLSRFSTDFRRIAAGLIRVRAHGGALVLVLLLTCAARPAGALVARVHPLGQIISLSDWIAAGRVTRVDVKGRGITVDLRVLKGGVKPGPASGSAPGATGKELLDRMKVGQSMVLFGSQSRGLVFGFVDGTWFEAHHGKSGWAATKLHPEMAATWTGKSDVLAKLVGDVLAGKAQAPSPNPKVKPSLGPRVRK